MSYSISAKAATKAELEILIRDKLAEVPAAQPVHEADVDQAFNAAKSFLDLMQDDPARDIGCHISGSIWKTDAGVQTVNLSIGFGFNDPVAAKAD